MKQDMPEPVKVYEPPLVAEVGAFAATTLGNLDPERPEGTFFFRPYGED
ncbi:lasso RiPP family leader peptide-containing protein [Streptosporangium sp. NPDC000239]